MVKKSSFDAKFWISLSIQVSVIIAGGLVSYHNFQVDFESFKAVQEKHNEWTSKRLEVIEGHLFEMSKRISDKIEPEGALRAL